MLYQYKDDFTLVDSLTMYILLQYYQLQATEKSYVLLAVGLSFYWPAEFNKVYVTDNCI